MQRNGVRVAEKRRWRAAAAAPALSRRSFNPAPWLTIGLILGTSLLYIPAYRAGFINLDDPDYVTLNPYVRSGLTFANVCWAFLTFHAANWHPLTWLSLQLDASLYGLHPAGYHLTNVLLHAASAGLLFLVLRELTGKPGRSFVIAALFAWHPLRVESVAWISERKDVLSVFFWMLSMAAYVRYVRAPSRWRMLGVASCMGLSLMAKPMAVTLPFVLLLLDWWPLQRAERSSIVGSGRRDESLRPAAVWFRLVCEKWHLFLLSLAASVIAVVAQQRGGTVHGTEELSLATRLGHAVLAAFSYTRMLVWPSHLAVFYPYQRLDNVLSLAAAVLVLVGITVIAFVQRRQRPWLAVGWLWYLGTLIPVIGLVQVGAQSRADRYTYIPTLGLLIALVWTAADFPRTVVQQRLAVAFAAVILIACAITSARQLGYWHDSVSLWERTIAVTAPNAKAHASLAGVLAEQERWADAARHYEQALAINPRYEDVRYNLGTAYLQLGELDQAVDNLSEYIAHHPRAGAACFNLGVALMRQGEWARARACFEKCLAVDAASWRAHHCLGTVCEWQGDLEEAVRQYDEAIEVNQRFAQAHLDRASVLGRLGKWQEAEAAARQAIQLAPLDARAHATRAWSLHALGEVRASHEEYARTLGLDQHWPEETQRAAWTLATQPNARFRNGPRALELASQLEQAAAGPSAEVLDTLAAADAECGHFKEAVVAADKALRLLTVKAAPSSFAAAMRERLALYESGQPFRAGDLSQR